MKRKLVLFLMIAAILCALFVGCGEDPNPTGTTGGDATQNTTEITDPIITTETDATIPGGEVITYTEFESMTGSQQKDVISKFESQEQFDDWYNEIKEDHNDYVETVKPPEIVNPNPTTEPTEEETGPIFPEATGSSTPEKDELTFLEYHNLTADEQKAFINTFESIDKFVEWHTAARKAYEDSLIEIDDTPIDAGELFGDKEDKGGN